MTNKILLIVLAILLPPLAVYLKRGVDKHLLINIVLCFVFYFPGIIHSLWVVTQD
ncbi:YqaE/Pmp3 family membrane protein [Wenyingzhuangia fucanilytica]|uniref:YqaE/Pmp3 family membrane protein n=1 Tax=Wenyingzhuangia fucanilytica TaxID=1790137 RepID=UPI00197D171E|nr:YqaE/Pmp3 family membrane protein [Wenyingzhuangia fucanilytica]